jgi:geranylgeranyl diphosphate synthase type I
VATELERFLDAKADQLSRIGSEFGAVIDLARGFTGGGKRMRPAFCWWGYLAAAPAPEDTSPLLRAAASLDLLHVSALVHDDLMDGSDTRRGMPAAHRRFEANHRAAGWRGDSEDFGAAAAILLGDLLLVWSEEMFATAGLGAAAMRARPYLDATRTEVAAGQILDVMAAARSLTDTSRPTDWAVTEAYRVVEYKTAKYTVQRPLQIGAALAGADEALQQSLAAYGSALGRAFQFRDDLLGVFGDSEVTGKPAGDDLREGKLTVLVGHTLRAVDEQTRARVGELLGDPALDESTIAELCGIITESGAKAAVEAEIADAATAARTAIGESGPRDEARQALLRLVDLSVSRRA